MSIRDKKIIELIKKCEQTTTTYFDGRGSVTTTHFDKHKFAELLLEEVREVLAEEYRKTPIECCTHFLRADEAIVEHFYGENNESR